MCTGAYRGRGVSRLMCTYALTLSLFMFLSYGVLFYLQKFNLTFIQKGCFCQKWLFFSNEINFCCRKISFFTLSCFSESKLAKTLLILTKQNLRYILYSSVIPYFENILCIPYHRDLFDKLFYIDMFYIENFFILLLLLLLLLLNLFVVVVS